MNNISLGQHLLGFIERMWVKYSVDVSTLVFHQGFTI